jgi:predicted component of type VI protein secretion system
MVDQAGIWPLRRAHHRKERVGQRADDPTSPSRQSCGCAQQDGGQIEPALIGLDVAMREFNAQARRAPDLPWASFLRMVMDGLTVMLRQRSPSQAAR